MRGRGLFCRKVPSLALPPEKTGKDNGGFWGERPLLREKRLSPQTPLSRRAAGVWVETFLLDWFRLRVGAVSCYLVVVAAADRAAATFAAYPQSALRLTAPSAEGALWRRFLQSLP